ncbi:FxSxx-COOH system tetratricopeptide repeat protein [Virgisporangium aurantiacum]|uniref:Tetratricopeptide repeat protein n=1 Tax=Virgisporangium aurantiacum TaxID=175570 RepID=A0A8J4E7F3_9ACTN|nr:FxSxx-COOH system tetratricopeptide repeat protein [Virgisporangium aurantiacum]GIJ64481.1 tetratricopeptide repeat protein [Virgisporangium aurantiacum]
MFHGPVTVTGRAAVTWPVRVGVVPPLVDCRQDRPADALLAGSTAGAVVVCQVLSGLGGVGKTQLVANLAHRYWDGGQAELLVWVSATSRTSIATTLAEAAARVTGTDDLDPEQGAARLLAWLAERHGRRWLIVFDDLTDPHDLTGLWPPASPSGRVVVTTRRRDSALLAGRQVIDVDVFTPEQAVAYLRHKFAAQPDRLREAAELAADLGYLPLALAQATAYILDRGASMTCAVYRRRLADQRRRLPELAPQALPDQHQATVAATWSLSIDRANRLAPAGLARPVLELAALLDPNAIPAHLLNTEPILDYCANRLDEQITIEDTDDALHLLHRFSLITVDEATATIRVHALVQRAVREVIDPDHERGLAQAAADALLQQWPGIERDHTHAQPLRTSTSALHANTGPLLWNDHSGAHPVLFQAGHSLGRTGLVGDAIEYFRRLQTQAEQRLGPDHPDTLAARNHLNQWRSEAGDPSGAAAACQDLLADTLRVLGPDHPDTLTTRANLAYCRGEAGDRAGAATAFQDLLTDTLRVLGPDHPATLTTRHHLANWRGRAGDPASAATAFQDLLTDRLRVLGPDHPGTLTTRASLVYWRGEAGDPAGAAAAYQDLLTDTLRILGPDHPGTLTTRANLADWRGEAGDPAAAAAAYQDLLTDTLRVLGPDHPDTLTTRHNFADWCGEAGDAEAAAAAYQDLLADTLRVLGPDHPDTLTTRANLAYWRGEVGDPAAAATAYQDLLTDRLRVLGTDHPDTLTTRANLAFWRVEAGNAAVAPISVDVQ